MRERFDYQDDREVVEEWLRKPADRSSPLCLLSFILGLLAGLGAIGLMILAVGMAILDPGGFEDDAPETILLGLAVIGTLAFSLIGMIFGIIGLARANRPRCSASWASCLAPSPSSAWAG